MKLSKVALVLFLVALATGCCLLSGPMRETVVNPLGLITRPNKYGQYPPGGMSVCKNVCMRDKGVITSLPGRQAYRTGMGALGGYLTRRIFQLTSRLIHFGDNAGVWAGQTYDRFAATNAITLTPIEYATAPVFGVGMLQMATSRGRRIVTSSRGALVLDSDADTSMRAAGFPAPSSIIMTNVVAGGEALPANTAAAWAAVVRRVMSDGYEITSEPTYLSVGENLSATSYGAEITVTLGSERGYLAGDILEIYRTRTVPSGSDPGATLYLTATVVLTGGATVAGIWAVNDLTPDLALGDELYTNPNRPVPAIVGIGGSYTNSPPPLGNDIFAFRGTTFYDATNLAQFIKTRVTSRFGELNTAKDRANGIGHRTVSGIATIGSPTITAVADTSGVVFGQRVTLPAFGTGFVSVVSKTVNTITFAQNSLVGGGVTLIVCDAWEIDGVINGFIYYGISNALPAEMQVITDTPIYFWGWTAPGFISSDYRTNGPNLIFKKTRPYSPSFTMRATNGQNYTPALPELGGTAQTSGTDPRTNRLLWSKPQQPEAVPPQQELIYGNGTHYRGIPTKDGVWLFASDGLHRLTGEQDEYRVDPVDTNLILAARNAADLLGETVYAYTERGLVAIDASGRVIEFARDVIGDLIPGAEYSDTWDTFVTCDEAHREVWLSFRVGSVTTSYIYSEITKAFTTFVDPTNSNWTAMAYVSHVRSLAMAIVNANTFQDTYYFNADSSLTRMDGADFSFQPWYLGDPNTLKQFVAVTYRFEGVSAGTIVINSKYEETLDGTTDAIEVDSRESAITLGVPIEYSMSTRLVPGFTLGAGSTTNLWSLRSASAQWTPLSEEGKR